MERARALPPKQLACLLRAALSVEEIGELTKACMGNPRLRRLAQACDEALELDPNEGIDVFQVLKLITLLYQSIE